MGLKQHDEPLTFERARRFERRLDLRWMMPVIVHHGVILGLQFDFESSPGPPERFERFRDFAKTELRFR